MGKYQALHARSISDPEGFWREYTSLIDWHVPCTRVLDYSRPPFAKWFVGGRTNLCHNAVDRHLAALGDSPALIYVSTETNQDRTFTFRELHREVNRMAGVLRSLGVGRGDRVLIYMPMIPEAVFAMLACVRIGAIHSVVFGGFASVSLATRIDDATPKVIVSADAGSRAGKAVPYKNLLDEAIRLSKSPPATVLLVDRGLAPMTRVAGRDVDYATLRDAHLDDDVPCEWLESSEPSYILYTSGTTGKPKGVQRDTGGYAVALAASMKLIYCGNAGETYFATSDIGWVVGHSYIVYGPLIAGMATILYEGTPIRPDGGIWWKIVEQYRVSVMFSAPTAIRVLKKQDPTLLRKYDLSSLRLLFLAGEPLDEPTARWIAEGIGKPVVDNYWQTETGWPILAIQRGVEALPGRYGSPGVPVYGYDVRLYDAVSGEEVGADTKGVVAIRFDVLEERAGAAGVLDLRLGHPRPGRLLLHPRPHGRRDQRGGSSPRHARDRGVHLLAPEHRRGRGGGRRRPAQGPGGDGVRDRQGRHPGRHAPEVPRPRGRDHEGGGHTARRGGATRPRAFRDGAAQDPLRQAAATLDPRALRGTGSRRPHDDRGPGST
jgi:propionyl-CoA synthetase